MRIKAHARFASIACGFAIVFATCLAAAPAFAKLTCNAGTCSAQNAADLAAAFTMANANPKQNYVVNLQAGTYTLTGPLNYNQTTGTLRLVGSKTAPGSYVIDGASKYQLINMTGSGTLHITGVTLQNGHSTPSPISVSGSGIIDLEVTYIQNNISNQFGGALTVQGSAQLQATYTAFSGNKNDQYHANQTYGGQTSFGGAVYIGGTANALFENDSFTYNYAGMGGAIAVSDTAGLTMLNCTVAKNSAMTLGGGIFVSGGPSVSLGFDTISQNTAGTGTTGGSYPNYGGGLGLDQFTGYFQSAGNVIAQNYLTNPSLGVGDQPPGSLAQLGTDCFTGTYVNGTVQPWSSFSADAYPNAIGDVTSCYFLEGDNSPVFYGSAASPFNPNLGTLSSVVAKYGKISLAVLPVLSGSWLLSSTKIASNQWGGYLSDSEDCNYIFGSWDCPFDQDEVDNVRPNAQNAVVNGVTYPGVGQADYGAYQPPGE